MDYTRHEVIVRERSKRAIVWEVIAFYLRERETLKRYDDEWRVSSKRPISAVRHTSHEEARKRLEAYYRPLIH